MTRAAWPENLLQFPARQAIGAIALAYLQQAAAAAQRLERAVDDEALHDFRVALRRLRTCLRAHADRIDDCVPKKARRRIRTIAAATGQARDAEVQRAWLRSEIGNLPPRRRPALTRLEARLEQRQRLAYEKIRADVLPDFRRAERKLRKALSALAKPPAAAADASLTFAQAVAPLVRQHVAELKTSLARFKSPAHVEEAHLARISAKRLRYLLEPVAKRLAIEDTVMRELRVLQDLLGELRDLQLLVGELGAAVEDAAVEQARGLLRRVLKDGTDPARRRAPRQGHGYAGLLTAASLAQAQQERLFRRIRAEYGHQRMAALAQRVFGLADQLAANSIVAGGAPAHR
ncbi:MAG: CHAD domain-containing protein [Gammaproteobacteria bacterium]